MKQRRRRRKKKKKKKKLDSVHENTSHFFSSPEGAADAPKERQGDRGAYHPLLFFSVCPRVIKTKQKENGDQHPADPLRPVARRPAGPHRRCLVGPASARGAAVHPWRHQRDAEVPEAFR